MHDSNVPHAGNVLFALEDPELGPVFVKAAAVPLLFDERRDPHGRHLIPAWTGLHDAKAFRAAHDQLAGHRVVTTTLAALDATATERGYTYAVNPRPVS